jgi:L-glutamine-phosphate cytidylyltransferase
MKAVILSAGQGKRLFPLTAERPKCILPVQGRTMIEWQVDELAKCGIEQVIAVLGYGADKVEDILRRRYGAGRVKTVYNSAYAVSDNLVSCWAVHDEMNSDFVLLNGDTLFEAAVLKRLLGTERHPVTVTISHKKQYDDDDMKVELDGQRLVKIGKNLLPDQVHGESIGMILFRDRGPMLFRDAIEKALRDPSSQSKWYLAVIDHMAQSMPVWTCSVKGLQWCEVDYPADLKLAENVVSACDSSGRDKGDEGTCRITEVNLI